MINVDVSKLREGIRDYNNILSNLSTNDAMIESKFNELASIWNDPNALKMFNSVNPNLRRVKYLESDIKSQIAAYSYACENYSKIGNFIINNGNATGEDIKALISLIQKEVKEKYCISLELEQELVNF